MERWPAPDTFSGVGSPGKCSKPCGARQGYLGWKGGTFLICDSNGNTPFSLDLIWLGASPGAKRMGEEKEECTLRWRIPVIPRRYSRARVVNTNKKAKIVPKKRGYLVRRGILICVARKACYGSAPCWNEHAFQPEGKTGKNKLRSKKNPMSLRGVCRSPAPHALECRRSTGENGRRRWEIQVQPSQNRMQHGRARE